MARPLSRPYTCVLGAPVLDHIDTRLFTLTYYHDCMGCGFCRDACCQYGVDTELPRVAALEKYQAELEAYVGVPRAGWFREDPEDIGYLDEPEYPGGKYTRTKVVPLRDGRSPHNQEACVFLDPVGRGCLIHRFALERHIPVADIKPMMCLLFPASFSKGVLGPAYEFDLENELVCQGPGLTLYRSSRADILHYFGPELVAELDAIEAETLADPAGGTIPLPVCTS